MAEKDNLLEGENEKDPNIPPTGSMVLNEDDPDLVSSDFIGVYFSSIFSTSFLRHAFDFFHQD